MYLFQMRCTSVYSALLLALTKSRVIINALIARSPSSLRSGGSKLPKCCIPYRLLVGNWPVAGVRDDFFILGTIDSRFLKTDTGVLTQELPGNARLH